MTVTPTGIPLGIRCVSCDGSGTRIERVVDCHHSQPCPCDTDDVECWRCGGDGRQPCEACGKPSAGVAGDGEAYCGECLTEIYIEGEHGEA